MAAILGKKLGMTQIFTEEGDRVPVTVIEAGPCAVTQVKTDDSDGYQALQIGFGDMKKNRVNKPAAGHFRKAGVDARRHLAEVRCDLDEAANWVTAATVVSEKKTRVGKKAKAEEMKAEAREAEVADAEAEEVPEGEAVEAEAEGAAETEAVETEKVEETEAAEPEVEVEQPESPGTGPKTGDQITVEAFQVGQKVKVSGVSKGKGFAGVIKRHNFSGGPGSHGSHFHRAPGSVGASAYPSRVFKGTKLPGQMGNRQSTQLGLTVVATDPDKNLLFLKGAVPGSNNKIVMIQTQ